MASNARQHINLRRIGQPLDRVIFALAQERADEIAGLDEEEGNLWAALLEDGPEVARRSRELLEAGHIEIGQDAIDPEEWASLEHAAGVIVTRDNEGAISVQPYRSEDDLAAAWATLMADLEPGEPGPATVATPEADDNPT